MRGKHGAASANRRERAELEQRAQTAEARAERLEKEIGELRESSRSSVSTLRAALSQARKDRHAAAAPTLAQAEERIRTLMAERQEAERQRDNIQDRWESVARNLTEVLYSMGLSHVEAIEALLAATIPDGTTRTVQAGPRRRDSTPEQIVALERARGQRGMTDLLHGRRPTA